MTFMYIFWNFKSEENYLVETKEEVLLLKQEVHDFISALYVTAY